MHHVWLCGVRKEAKGNGVRTSSAKAHGAIRYNRTRNNTSGKSLSGSQLLTLSI